MHHASGISAHPTDIQPRIIKTFATVRIVSLPSELPEVEAILQPHPGQYSASSTTYFPHLEQYFIFLLTAQPVDFYHKYYAFKIAPHRYADLLLYHYNTPNPDKCQRLSAKFASSYLFLCSTALFAKCMPDKNKPNLGLATVFLPIQRCARCLPYSITLVRYRHTELIFCGIYDRIQKREVSLLFGIQNITHGTYKRKNAEDVKYNEKTF